MAVTYRDTLWRRRSDGAHIRIESDIDAWTGRGNRDLRAINTVTGRAFWVTPEGLARKYVEIEREAGEK